MTGGRPVAHWEELRLPDVDPAPLWVVAGDLERLDEWAGTHETTWRGDLPRPEDRFTTWLHVAGSRRILQGEVVSWDAGRRFRLKLTGLPWSGPVDVECRVESQIESGRAGTTIGMGYGAQVNRWLAALVVAGAARRMRRALRRLRDLAEQR